MPVWGQGIHPTLTIINIAALVTTFNAFSYDTILAQHRTHHLSDAELIRYAICQRRRLLYLTKMYLIFKLNLIFKFVIKHKLVDLFLGKKGMELEDKTY